MKHKNKKYINRCLAGVIALGINSTAALATTVPNSAPTLPSAPPAPPTPVALSLAATPMLDTWDASKDSIMGLSGEGREVFSFSTSDGRIIEAVNFNGLAYIGDVIVGETEKLKSHGLHFATNEDNSQSIQGIAPQSAIIHYESTWTGKAWPNATIPYSVNGVTGEALENFNAAVAYWNAETNVQFIPRTTQSDYLNVTTGTWCSSWIGMQGGGQQVTMHPGCGLSGAVHELGHAVGLHHEQVRHDRDEYVDIIWDNIPQANKFNFDKYLPNQGRDFGEYDYYSVMHYFATAFGSGTITIQPKDPSVDLSLMGYSEVLSATDKAAVEDLYFNAPPPGNTAPVADFSWNTNGLEVTYTDTSIDDRGITYWLWDLGDGTSSSEQNPVHTYASNPGYGFTVRLTAVDESGLSHQKAYVVQVGGTGGGGAPDADFSYSANGLTVNFTDTSTDDGEINYWQWNYGDGQYGYTANPTHTYANPGTYNVELRVNDSQGLQSTKTYAISVTNDDTNQAPNANFTYTKNDLSVSFTDASSDDNGISSYAWNFGDGYTSNEASPNHSYVSAGTYSVTLTTTDTEGLSDTKTIALSVTDGQTNTPPSASFNFNTSGLTANFTDTSTDDNGVISRLWDFGDGQSSTAANPSHLYAVAGSYSVTLTVNDAQALSAKKTSTVTVTDPIDGGVRDGSCTANKAYLIENGQTTNVALASKASECYLLQLPENAINYTVSTNANNGDMDLYTKKGSVPSTSVFDCSATSPDSNEVCSRNTTAGELYIRLYAWSATSNLTFTASYDESGTTPPVSTEISGDATGTISNSNVEDYIGHYGLEYIDVAAGTIKADLSGPNGTDFELDLQKQNGSTWTTVQSSTLPTSTESINYNATTGRYRFKVYRYSGTGNYDLTYSFQE